MTTTGRQLHGCNAIITGASRGLGRAIAEAFWREGASLLLAARSTAKLEQVAQSLPPQADCHVSLLTVDLADDAATAHIMSAVILTRGLISAIASVADKIAAAPAISLFIGTIKS